MCDGFELFNRSGSLEVRGGEHDGAALFFEDSCELAAGGGLSGTLEAAHHDDGWAGGEFHDSGRGGLLLGVWVSTEEFDESFVDDADHLLAWFERLGDLLTHGVGHDLFAELVGDFVVDIRFEERGADLVHGFFDIGLGDGGVAAEFFEGVVETV